MNPYQEILNKTEIEEKNPYRVVFNEIMPLSLETRKKIQGWNDWCEMNQYYNYKIWQNKAGFIMMNFIDEKQMIALDFYFEGFVVTDHDIVFKGWPKDNF